MHAHAGMVIPKSRYSGSREGNNMTQLRGTDTYSLNFILFPNNIPLSTLPSLLHKPQAYLQFKVILTH